MHAQRPVAARTLSRWVITCVPVYVFLVALGLALGGPYDKLAVLAAAAPLAVALAYLDLRLVLVPFLVLAWAPLPSTFPTQAQVLGIDLRLTDVVVPLAVVAVLPGADRRPRLPSVALLAALALVAMVVHGLVAGASPTMVVRDSRGVLYLIATFAIGSQLVGSTHRRHAVGLTLAILWYSAVAVLVVSVTSLPLLAGRVEQVAVSRSYGVDLFAATRFLLSSTALAMFVLCAAGSYLMTEPVLDRRRRGQLWALTLPAAVVVFFSFSRNSLVALGASLVFTLPFASRRRRMAGVVAGLAAAVVVVGAVGPRLGPVGSYVADQVDAYRARVVVGVTGSALRTDTSAAFRKYENRWALRAARSSPLVGHGAGYRYRPVLSREPFADRETGPTYIHGFYLWALVKMGVLGLAALLATLVVPMARAISVLRRTAAPEHPLAVAISAGIVGILAVGPVAPILDEIPSAVILGLAAGFLYGLAAAAPSDEQEDRWGAALDPGGQPPAALVGLAR